MLFRSAQRRERQQAILRSLLARMCNGGALESVPDLYATYCEHTRQHLLTYLPPGAPPFDIRFDTLASVCKGDPTHRRMCDYMAAQAVLLEEPNGHCAMDWAVREYADMLVLARTRLIYEKPEPTPADEE